MNSHLGGTAIDLLAVVQHLHWNAKLLEETAERRIHGSDPLEVGKRSNWGQPALCELCVYIYIYTLGTQSCKKRRVSGKT